MPVTPDEAQWLAVKAAEHRPHGAPQWRSEETFNVLKKIRERHFVDVALALFRAVDDREARSAAVLLSPQSQHWRERATDRPAPHQPFNASDTCGTCSMSEALCRAKWADDHEFEPIPRLKQRVEAEDFDTKAIVSALHELAPTRPEPVVLDTPALEPPEVPTDYAAARAQLTTTQRANEKQAETEESQP